MKLLWIFLVFLIQSEFGDCWKCEFYDIRYGYRCFIKPTFIVKEQHVAGKTDDDVKKIKFYGSGSENLTQHDLGPLCERFKNVDEIWIDQIKSVSEDLLQQCMNLKEISISYSEMEELSENLFSNLTKLTSIDFYSNNLKPLPEKIFASQKNLEKLDLEWNKIYCLPPNIFDSLTMLKELKLGGNRIQSLDPKWFENLHSLKYLSLNRNNLQDLPKNVFKNLKKLETLDLDWNQLTTIHSDSFPTQGNLKILRLSWGKIRSIDEKILDLNNLNQVDMSWGSICCKEDITSRNNMKEKLQKCFDNYQPRVDPAVSRIVSI